MQKLFGSRSQAIQLSSDDEDEFAGSTSGFGCVSCLPRFSMLGGNGTIRIPEDDATLDDYLDPNTTTTIEPLLEEYNQQSDNAFNGAALQDSQRFLSRNPFASSTANPTTANDLPTQHTFETSNDDDDYQYDSYQEQQQHSFTGAAPRVDFFLENDENDAEFLSDHRISAVIGDPSKLTSQFELFKSQETSKDLSQKDYHSQSSSVDDQVGNDEQGDDRVEMDMEPAEPFEIQNNWTEDALNNDFKIDDMQHEQHMESDTDGNLQQQHSPMDDTNDIPTHAKTLDGTITSSVDKDTNETIEEWKQPADALPGNTSSSRNMDDMIKEMDTMNLSTKNDDSNIDTNAHGDVPLDEDNVSNADAEPSLSTFSFATSPNISNSTQLTDMKQDDCDGDETNEEIANTMSTDESAPSIPSSPPSPIPTMSTENAQNAFPSTGLPRTPITVQTQDDSPISTSESDSLLQHSKNNDETSNISTNDGGDNTISSSSGTSNANQLSIGPVTDEMKGGVDGKRRSSVAAVAHSLLGDKLDDFTEKLAYIRKNIIMSLDDDDEDSDDYYNEDMAKYKQQQQHQQLRRSRSGSMQQEMRRQSFDPSVSRLPGNAQQQQQRRQSTRSETTNDPRTHHRRSNSLMEGANSFAKIFQQIGGQHEGESNHQRHFSPSSFFASLAGPDIPTSPPSSTTALSSSASPLPQRSSSMSSPALTPAQQQYQYPTVSRSATQLHTNQPLSRPHNNESFLQNVSEEENVDEEDLFDFSKMIAMGKNVRNMSEDLMGNGIRLFNDFSTRMKNANANRMGTTEQSTSTNTTTSHQYQGQYDRQPQPQQEHQTSSMDQEFLLGDTYI